MSISRSVMNEMQTERSIYMRIREMTLEIDVNDGLGMERNQHETTREA